MTYINSYYSNSAYYNTLRAVGENTTSTSADTSANTSTETASDGGATSSDPSKQLTSDILKVLEGLGAAQGGTLSFADIQKEADKLEDQFDEQVLADLKALGVDTDTKFQLSYDSTKDAVVCSKGHPDKEKIDNYFTANPERKEQFKSLIALRSLNQQASSANLNPTQFKQQMQLQSMAVWFGESMTADNFMGAQGIIFGAQNAYYKSVNLTV